MPAKKTSQQRKNSGPNIWIIAVITLLVVVTLVSLYVNKAPSTGQAIQVSSGGWPGGTIPLEQEGQITFTSLPATRQEINFTVGQTLYAPLQEYNFTLIKLGLQSYLFILSRYERDPGSAPGEQKDVARDLLFTGSLSDRSVIYLDEMNPVPQLEVLYQGQGGRLTLRNLHYVAAERAQINLLNASGAPYPLVISMEKDATLSGTIAASSTIAPEDIGGFTSGGTLNFLSAAERDPLLNSTQRSFSYTAPAAPGAVTLDLTATVRGQETHAYYTIAAGNVAYSQLGGSSGYPRIIFMLNESDADRSRLTITFNAVTELQPLALPCEVNEPFSTLFAGKAIQRVYTYMGGAPGIWTNGSTANDFTSFEPFQGYFIQLSEAIPTTLAVNCPIRSMVPASASSATPGTISSLQLGSGWNAFALQGVLSRPLTEFTSSQNFRLFECAEGYACTNIASTTPLRPGRPYWIYTETPLTITYRLQ